MFGLGSGELSAVAVFFLFLFIPGFIGTLWAGNKGRSRLGWFTLGVIFPPSVLALLFLKPGKEIKGRHKACPACKEFVKWEASVCKYCQTAIDIPI